MPTEVLTDSDSFGPKSRLLLGEGLFETMRVSKAKVVHASLHWNRLSQAAKSLDVPFDLNEESWLRLLEERIARANLVEGGLKVILAGKEAPRGLTNIAKDSQILVQAFQYTVNQNPVRLVSASWLRDAANPVYQVKSVNYLEAIIAQKEAQAKGYDDALFFNTNHQATETTCSNFFVIKNNTLLTPPLSSGVLPGITRAVILALCKEKEIPFEEVVLSKSMIASAQTAFITNSLQGIRVVASLDEIQFATTHPFIEILS